MSEIQNYPLIHFKFLYLMASINSKWFAEPKTAKNTFFKFVSVMISFLDRVASATLQPAENVEPLHVSIL